MYTRTYSIKRSSRIVTVAAALAIGIPCCAGVWYSVFVATELNERIVFGGLTAPILVVAIYGILAVLKRHLVLTTQELRIHGVFRTRVVRRADIKRFRVLAGTRTLRLEVQEPGAARIRRVDIDLEYVLDEAFGDWFEGLEDANLTELQQSVEEVQADQRLGDSVEQRVQNLKRSRRIAKYLNRATLAVALWACVFPWPYGLLMTLLLLLPWLVLGMGRWRPGWFSVAGMQDNDLKGDLRIIPLLAASVLALRAILDVALVQPSTLLWPALLATVAMVGCFAWVEPEYRKPYSNLLILAFVAHVYAPSSVALLDQRLDRARPVVHEVTVLAVDAERKYATVSAWGPHETANDVRVSSRLGKQLAQGDSLCIFESPGALRMAWYEVHSARHCTRAAAPESQ